MTAVTYTEPVAGPNSPPVSGGLRGNPTGFSEGQYQNWVLNNDFMNWPDGDASAPAYWRTTGSPTIARAGLGLADTTRRFGPYCAKVTSGGATGVLEQRVIKAASFDTIDSYLQDSTVRLNGASLGVWIWCATSSAVRAAVYDGVDETPSDDNATTSAWEWLDLTHDFNTGATELTVRISGDASAVFYVSGPTLWLGPVKPKRSQLPLVLPVTLMWPWAGEVATGDDALGLFPSYPAPWVATGAYLYAGTAPTGAALQIQIAKNGSDDIFTTKPEIAAAASPAEGSQVANGTYANRCFDLNDRGHLDIDQVGSTEEGEDLNVFLRGFAHSRGPLGWLDFEEID